MVWNSEGSAPTYRHTSRRSAETEAERLALKTGEVFYVLEAVVMKKRLTPVETVILEEVYDPFGDD